MIWNETARNLGKKEKKEGTGMISDGIENDLRGRWMELDSNRSEMVLMAVMLFGGNGEIFNRNMEMDMDFLFMGRELLSDIETTWVCAFCLPF